MLPALSSSAGFIARLRHWGVGALLLLCLLLPLTLAGCGGLSRPPRAVLLQAACRWGRRPCGARDCSW